MIVNLAACLSVIMADGIAVVLTWIKTCRHLREASQMGIQMSVSATLLRDGERPCAAFSILLLTLMNETGSLYFLYVFIRPLHRIHDLSMRRAILLLNTGNVVFIQVVSLCNLLSVFIYKGFIL